MAEWRVIPEHPQYWVSDEGQVKKTFKTREGWLLAHTWKPNNGAWGVVIAKNGKGKFYPLGRLVWRLFSDLPLPRAIGHKDGNKANNALQNLCEGHTGRKRALTPEQIEVIRKPSSYTTLQLAIKLGTTEAVVNRYKRAIRKGKL